MNLRVHEMKRGKISQFRIFPIIYTKEMFVIEKIGNGLLVLLFMLFEFEERDILYKNTFEHNSPFWIQFFAIDVQQALKERQDI